MSKNVKKMTILANLLAVAIILNIVESWLAIIPVPGAKIGLANIVTLIVLVLYGPKESLILLVARVILVSLLTGKLFNVIFYMSFSGGIVAIIIMIILYKSDFFGLIGISVLGSLGHTIGQILMAMVILSSAAVISYLPIMLLVSIPAGIVTGIITTRFLTALKHVNVS